MDFFSTNLTLGEAMFYSGIAGAVLILLIAAVATAALKNGKKRIVEALNKEYAGNIK